MFRRDFESDLPYDLYFLDFWHDYLEGLLYEYDNEIYKYLQY